MVEVLISTMFLKNVETFMEKFNLNCNAVIVNQCDDDSCQELTFKGNRVLLIHTSTRGLSKSRNIAIQNATSTYCVLCDDDEVLALDLRIKVIHAFSQLAEADLIVFKVHNLSKHYPSDVHKISFTQAMRVSSVQVAFKRVSLEKHGILFDESLGAGISAGGGEENLFLFDALKKKLKIYYFPEFIATLLPSISTWKNGFKAVYFRDKGVLFTKLFGRFLAVIYGIYFVIFKRKLFKADITLYNSFLNLMKGIFA